MHRAQSDICDAGCSAQDSALQNCVITFCLANTTDADCQALLGG